MSSTNKMSSTNERQAVLVIHGIGEQRPMETLRGFVDAVWSSDPSVHHDFGVPDVWSKPDTISGSYELRRLTTGQNRAGVRTDFFELYWAHRMQGTSWGHLASWVRTLAFRNPAHLSGPLRLAWALLWLVAALAVAVGVALQAFDLPAWASLAASAFVVLVAGPALKKVIGDAARYLHPSPDNIARRQEIRAQGVEILRALHEHPFEGDGGYDRILVVGHSLGSVIGYDILTHAWALYHHQRTKKRSTYAAREALEELAREAQGEPSALEVRTWQPAQRRYLDELQAAGCPWRVTDFVTLGSPLTHAEALLARDLDDLRRRQESRELPTCPPVLEGSSGKQDDSFSYPKGNKNRKPHHGAVFAPTRWTNLYFPSRGLIWGDFIGGPLAPLFGPGIRDVPVRTRRRRGFLSHTLYWRFRNGDQAHVEALRRALNLLDQPEAELYGEPAEGSSEDDEPR